MQARVNPGINRATRGHCSGGKKRGDMVMSISADALRICQQQVREHCMSIRGRLTN